MYDKGGSKTGKLFEEESRKLMGVCLGEGHSERCGQRKARLEAYWRGVIFGGLGQGMRRERVTEVLWYREEGV